MKTVKILGLAAVVAAALIAFVGVGTASAGGVLCEIKEAKCPAGSKWPVKTLLDFELEGGTEAKVWSPEGGITYTTCPRSTLETEIETNPNAILGEATTRNAALTWQGGMEQCTNPMTSLELGNLRFSNINETFNGTVVVDSEIKLTIKHAVLGKCVYVIKSGTHFGEVKEGKVELGSTSPTLAVNAQLEKKATGEDPCGLGWPLLVNLTASYEMKLPVKTTLVISKE
jgi:hypothetical protein